MIEVSILEGIIAVFIVMHIYGIRRHFKTKDKPDLHFSMAYLFWVVAAIFGVLIGFATITNNSPLTPLFYRASTTSGVLSYVFVNRFAVAVTKPDEKCVTCGYPYQVFLL